MSENEKWLKVMKPKSGLLDIDLIELVKKKDLIFLFVRREFVAKYKQTVLGPAGKQVFWMGVSYAGVCIYQLSPLDNVFAWGIALFLRTD